jgi:hypothetical protein
MSTADYKAFIEDALKKGPGLTVDSWREDESRPVAALGRWTATRDADSEEFFVGDEGELTCTVVGGAQYNNERPQLTFTPEGMEMGADVSPSDLFDLLEPADR